MNNTDGNLKEINPVEKGYALLGSGRYCINHSSEFDPVLGAELVITIASDSEKSGNRQIGEARDNAENNPPIQADEMVIRIGFLSERGLFALEDQLSMLRELHFPIAKVSSPNRQTLSDLQILRISRHTPGNESDLLDFAREIEAEINGGK